MIEKIPDLYFGIYIGGVTFLFLLAEIIFGHVLKFYDKKKSFDLIMHSASSALLFTVLGYWIVMKYINNNFLIAAMIGFLFSVALNALWEIVEFLVDTLFNLNMQRWKDKSKYIRGAGLIDIMTDIIACTSGSVFSCIVLIILHFV